MTTLSLEGRFHTASRSTHHTSHGTGTLSMIKRSAAAAREFDAAVSHAGRRRVMERFASDLH